jgi:chromosome segregation ATPase
MEAMILGKPVIATAWSGNMSYMDNTNSCLVSYKLIPANGDYAAYKKELFEGGAVWADASIGEAAAWMKKLVDDPGLRVAIGGRAAEDMARYQEKAKQGTFVDELQKISQQPRFLPESLERKRLTERWLRNLENELDASKGHVRALKQERDSLRDHISNLELERNTLKQQAADLQSQLDKNREHASNLEQELTGMRNSRSWRWTAGLRSVFDMVGAITRFSGEKSGPSR